MSWPDVAIISLFRDHERLMPQYIRQIEMLDYPRQQMDLVAVEGDSIDNTLAMLEGWPDKRLHLIQRTMHLPKFPSIANPVRLRAMSVIGNAGLEYVARRLNVEYILWLESDLIIRPDLLKRLIIRRPAAIAPMVWVEIQAGRPVFYDTWGFRKLDGTRFPQNERNWYANMFPRQPFEVQSAGSAVLIEASYIYDGARFDDEAIVGLCKQLRSAGCTILCDPSTHIQHPWPRG
ncbi:MAG: hypothetical protein ACE5FD_01280 [Anaerolineae bacterium]